YRRAAEDVVRAQAPRALAQPFAYGALLRAAVGLVHPPRQLVVVASDRTGALADAARRADADVAATVSSAQADAFAAAGCSLLEGQSGPDRAYDCRAFTSRLPTADPVGIPSACVP